MFKAKLSNPILLKSAFDSISSIADELLIKIDSEGLRIDTLDKSNTTFVHLNLKASLFDEYVCEDSVTLSIDTIELLRVLKLAKSDDDVILTCDDFNLIVIFEGESSSKFNIKLIDILDEQRPAPELDFLVSLELPTNVFKDMVNKVDKVTNAKEKIRLELKVDEDYIFASGGSDFADVDIKYLHGEKVSNMVKSVFRIEKINNILRAEKVANYIELKLGNDMPLSINFKFNSNGGELSYLLAPVIEREDEE